MWYICKYMKVYKNIYECTCCRYYQYVSYNIQYTHEISCSLRLALKYTQNISQCLYFPILCLLIRQNKLRYFAN